MTERLSGKTAFVTAAGQGIGRAVAEAYVREGARVIATGRSDFPNQINNVLAFPGVFQGAMAVRATRVTEGMKQAAALALAAVVGEDLSEECVIPSVFDPRVTPVVSAAVAAAARSEGVARL